MLQRKSQKRLQGLPQGVNDIVPIADQHCRRVIIDAVIDNMEYDVLRRVLRQQRKHSDGETDDVFDVKQLADVVLLNVVDDVL